MRITHNILISNFLRNLNSISTRIERSQQQLSTGLNYSRPADGPVEVGQIVGYRASISKIGQYIKNVDDGSSQTTYIDSIIQAVINDTGRVRDLAIDAANDDFSLKDRQGVAQEINLILNSTLSNANSRFRNRYTFAGWQTGTQPFEAVYNPRTGFLDDVIFSGNRGNIDRLVGDTDMLTVNVSGKDIFLNQTYTRKGKVLPPDKALEFSGTLTINGIDFTISTDMTLTDIQLSLEAMVDQTHVFASIVGSRLVLESATAVSEFTITDNSQDRLIENLGLKMAGATNLGTAAPTLPIIDSTPAIFTGAGPVANLTYDNTNNVLNIFLGANANGGISKAENIYITPGTYASVTDLITEIQSQIDLEFGTDRVIVSDAGGGVLQIETFATGDEINMGDLVIGGTYFGIPDTASDSADLNLIAAVGSAPATPAGVAGTDGNDKIIIDLGPSASKTGNDVLPQVINLRASAIVTVNDLVDELNYQIFQNDTLRGTLDVSLYNGRLRFETLNKGEEVLSDDLQISEGATGTLSALGISDVQTPAMYVGSPLVFPFIVVAGFNDTISIDLGPTVSVDGTDPPPVALTITPGIYNNINQIFNEINTRIQGNQTLNGAIKVQIAGPVGNEYLVLVSNKVGPEVRGEDLSVSGPLAGTLGWLGAAAIHGGGTADGQGIELEPANIFSTLINVRNDMMGSIGPGSKFLDSTTADGELLGMMEGDIVTVKYDAGTFTFRVLAGDTFNDFAQYLQEIFDTRATVRVASDGRIEIENLETLPILDLSITAESVNSDPRVLFNDIMADLNSDVPGLSSTTSKIIYDTFRYRRLGDQDLALSDNDLEICLRHEAIVGARANRLSSILNLFTAEDLNIRSIKTSVEAANYPEVLTLLSQQELVLQSALGVASKVLTPSLLGFLM